MMNHILKFSILVLFSLSLRAEKSRSSRKKVVPAKTATERSVVRKKRVTTLDYNRHTVLFGAVLWTDNIELKTSDGRSEDVILSMTGYSLGYSFNIMKDVDYAFQLGAQAHFLNGKAKSRGSSIDYKSDSDKIMSGVVFGNAIYFPDNNVSLGVGLEAMYYVVSLPRPSSGITVYEFNYASQMQTLYHFELTWYMDTTWSIRQTLFASVSPRVGTGWNVSLGYLF